MRSLILLFSLASLFVLLISCKPKVSDDFTQKVLYLSKQQAGLTESELQANKARVIDTIAASEQQANELEKKGLLYKKLANKYLDLLWVRSTIKANLPQTGQTTLTDTGGNPVQSAPDSVPDDQELNDYQNALHYLLLSLETFNDDTYLYYNAGLCTAHIGKYYQLKSGALAGAEWYKKAKQYYTRALELDENYTEALYGLAILLVFETHEPEQGISYLLRIKEHERYNTDARFLLAYAYYITGGYRQALLEYEELEKLAKKPESIAQIRKNKEQILALLNQAK